MKQDFKILLVEDDPTFREGVLQLLGVYNDVDGVADLGAARAALQRNSYEVVILDKQLPDGNGLELIPEIKSENPNAVIIILTADNDFSSVKRCITAGADDYVVKTSSAVPDLLVRLPIAVEGAAETRQLSHLKKQLLEAFKYEIVGKSASTAELRATILGLKGTDSHVLITGESGTGKELIARRLHAIDGRAGSFIEVNCAALPENLVESELFGSKKGAFTGAVDKIGYFELANGGDLFLDEIGELPLPAQAKLLRAIQEKKFFRIGASKPVEVKCRIIAATNQNLEELVKKKKFREDLYYRLNVVRIETTPLRERMEDVPDIARFFCTQMAKTSQTKLSERAAKQLTQHDWPGNIRELKNVIERALIRSRHRQPAVIDGEDILLDKPIDSPDAAHRRIGSMLPSELVDLTAAGYQEFMEMAEREYFRSALSLTNNSVAEVAARIGLGRSTIFKKMASLGLERRGYGLKSTESESEDSMAMPEARA